MTELPIPVNNVCYWIQNLDFGTFLGLVYESPVNRTTNKATFVVRPKKDDISTQEVLSAMRIGRSLMLIHLN